MASTASLRLLFTLSIVLVVILVIFGNILLYVPSIRNIFGKSKYEGKYSAGLDLLRSDGVFFGVTIDWQHGDLPSAFAIRMGKSPALFQFFINVTDRLTPVDELKYIIRNVAAVPGAVLALTIMPVAGLAVISDSTIDQITRTADFINSAGVPILLRFGHEMNGNWYPWGQSPTAYKETFVRLSNAIKERTKSTYMVWAPNTGLGYPWVGNNAPYNLNATNPDFKIADTNRDGVLNHLDDPYSPYYPGDEHVDFVGLSIFYFGSFKDKVNLAAPPTHFEESLIGNPNGGYPLLFNFYDLFCTKRNKPISIMETAAAYFPDIPGSSDEENLTLKQKFWGQLYNVTIFSLYPKLRVISWFDIQKDETDPNGVHVFHDFAISRKSAIMKAFVADMPNELQYADSPTAKRFPK